MSAMASQITSLTIVCATVYSGVDQRKEKSSASLAFYAGDSPVTGEFPAQRASNAENVSIWWRHHGLWQLMLILATVWKTVPLFRLRSISCRCTGGGLLVQRRCFHFSLQWILPFERLPYCLPTMILDKNGIFPYLPNFQNFIDMFYW